MLTAAPIATDRLSLVLLEDRDLAAMQGQLDAPPRFTWPSDWPDAVGRDLIALWRDRIASAGSPTPWGPRALVDAAGAMIGHAGFHLPPAPLHELLAADPTFRGDPGPPATAVEIGYTLFPAGRGHGYATEAAAALIDHAFRSTVDAVIVTVATDNARSLAVLDRLGAFEPIGRCADGDTAELVLRRDRA